MGKVYQNISTYISSSGLSLEDTASLCGYPEEEFRSLLNGSKTMDSDDLRRICLSLNVPPEIFVNND